MLRYTLGSVVLGRKVQLQVVVAPPLVVMRRDPLKRKKLLHYGQV